MFFKTRKKIGTQKGQVMIITILLLVLFTASISIGLVAPTLRNLRLPESLQNTKQSLYVMESGAEDAIYRVKNNITIGSLETLTVNGLTATTSIADVLGNKSITSTGNANNYYRRNAVTLTAEAGVSFAYAIQVGTGGITMNNHSMVIGNLYSHGNITANNDARITGSAIVSGSTGAINGSLEIGNATSGITHAHTVTGVTAYYELRCKVGSNNNKSCNTSFPDAATSTFPISNDDITAWKAEALTGGTYSGNYTLSGSNTSTLGPKKVSGSVTLNNDAILTVTGTLHIQGNLTLNNKGVVKLATSYGNTVGVIVVDGTVTFNNDGTITGNGQTGNYVFLIVTGNTNVTLNNAGGAVVINAQNGTVTLNNHAGARALVAKTIIMNNDATITYDTGLIDPNFTSGPSGAWVVSGWRETN